MSQAQRNMEPMHDKKAVRKRPDTAPKTNFDLSDCRTAIQEIIRIGQTQCTSGLLIRLMCGSFLSQIGVPASVAWTAKAGRFIKKNHSTLGLTHVRARSEKDDNKHWTTVQEYAIGSSITPRRRNDNATDRR